MLTKNERQEIIREYAARHGGRWDAAGFLEEVRTSNGAHPAYGWFTWDRDRAAQRWQMEEARSFAQGLRVTFRIEEIAGRKGMKVRERQMPAVISPVADRPKGGGYVVTEPENPDHMAEHCRQAAQALRQFIRRYEAALAQAGVSETSLERSAQALDRAGRSDEAA